MYAYIHTTQIPENALQLVILDVKVQELVSVKHKYVMESSIVQMDQMKITAVR